MDTSTGIMECRHLLLLKIDLYLIAVQAFDYFLSIKSMKLCTVV